MPLLRHFIVATAGHVDHGKSSLVRALTGIDPDRLPEEKARGITIELGFAHLELTDRGTPGEQTVCSLGMVDVPGHEDFVRNMVAGVGSIDLALLVVAADDGWMPQTEEHLQILEYLGVRRGVVAVTKSDLVTALDPVLGEVRARLQGSSFATAPIVPTSVPGRCGLDELCAAMLSVLRTATPPADHGRPRLAVDRVFTLKGLGTVVTGTLSRGGLRMGQDVMVQPGGLSARVRSIQSHNQQLAEASPGMRTALNLPEVPLAAPGQAGIARGDWVTVPGVGVVAETWQVQLTNSSRPAGRDVSAMRTLRSGVRLHVHHGTACHAARLHWLEPVAWEPGAVGLARLHFERPVFAVSGDRFVIRDWSERRTLAGGRFVLPCNPLATRRDAASMNSLRCLAEAVGEPHAWLAALLTLEGKAEWPAMVAVSPHSRVESQSAARRLVDEGRVMDGGGLLVARPVWERWLAQIQAAVQGFHQAHPEKPGLPLADARAELAQLPEALTDALVAALAGRGIVRNGAFLRAATHVLKLTPELEGAGRRVRRLLNEKPLEPPSRKELAPDAMSQKVLRYLLDAGEAVDLGPELVLSAAAYTRAVAVIGEHLRRTGGATVSELRPVLGTSRRILIPLLEHLDKRRVTVRQGDVRKPGPAA